MTDQWDEMTPEQIEQALAEMELERQREELASRLWSWETRIRHFLSGLKKKVFIFR
jgi:hypothetical protein